MAYQAYVQFVAASMNGNCPEMYVLAESEAVAYVDNLCKPRTMVILGKEIQLGSVASNIAETKPAATPFSPLITLERTIESEDTSADGNEVDLVVQEKSYQRNGNLLEPSWFMKHSVTARKSDAGWKITSFSEEVLRDYGAEAAEAAAHPSEQ
jgi:hypothetical protein